MIMSKNVFKNSEYIRENLPGRMKLFELLILKSEDLNLIQFYHLKFYTVV